MKVIYVVGWGHSGSTLLDLILATSPRVTSVGEITFFDFYRQQRHHPKVLRPFLCTCEQPFDACPFWKDVLADIEEPAVFYDRTGLERLRWLLRYFRWLLGGRKTAPAAGDDALLFEQVLRVSGGRTALVCDSSKDFARLIRLLMNPEVEVYPVHLVRDVRAVAWSYASRKRVELGLKRVGYYKGLVLWAAVNGLSRLVLRLSGRPFLALSYESLCRETEQSVARLNEWLDLELDAENLLERVNSLSCHDIGGNLLRFKKLEAIRCDERWRREAPRLGRVVGRALFGWLNALWVRRNSA